MSLNQELIVRFAGCSSARPTWEHEFRCRQIPPTAQNNAVQDIFLCRTWSRESCRKGGFLLWQFVSHTNFDVYTRRRLRSVLCSDTRGIRKQHGSRPKRVSPHTKKEAEREVRGASQLCDKAPPEQTTFASVIKQLSHELFVRCNSSTLSFASALSPMPRFLVHKELKRPDSCRKCEAAIGYN